MHRKQRAFTGAVLLCSFLSCYPSTLHAFLGCLCVDESGEEEEEAAPRKLQRLGSQQARQQRKTQARSQPDSHPM